MAAGNAQRKAFRSVTTAIQYRSLITGMEEEREQFFHVIAIWGGVLMRRWNFERHRLLSRPGGE